MAKIHIKKSKYLRLKERCTIGTVGHVDHGKTTLTAAITKVLAQSTSTKFVDYSDIDRDSIERLRGITINATHLEYETEARYYTHIDCPGHQDFMKNMIIGANQMDGVILVVSAIDGPQEQTREHALLLKEIGLTKVVVYFNKVDMVVGFDEGLAEMFSMEIYEFLDNYGLYEADLPVIFGSARQALNQDKDTPLGWTSIKRLMHAVDSWIPTPNRDTEKPFLMPVEESHSITGRGTVLTGKVERGILSVGDIVNVYGKKIFETSCAGLEMFHKVLEQAMAGDNVGILVKGLGKKDVKRGNILAKKENSNLILAYDIIANIYVLTPDEGGRKSAFVAGFQPQFYFRTSNVTGTIILPSDVSFALVGETLRVRIVFVEKVVIEPQLRFAIREGSTTVGAGVFIGAYNSEIDGKEFDYFDISYIKKYH